jgi:hypothetical protein
MAGNQDSSPSKVYSDMMDQEFSQPNFTRYTYRIRERDPFKVPLEVKKESKLQKRETHGDKYIQPAIQLRGVMDGMAILSGPGEHTYFVEENDSFNNISVKHIYQDSVHLVYEGKNFTVYLNGTGYEVDKR